MSWSYDKTDLSTTSASGRLNIVRFLVGDTDSTDKQVDNEEILFGLSQNNNNTYSAASFVCRVIAAKYARQVNLNLDDQIEAEYGELHKHYLSLAEELEYQGKKSKALGVKAGGISKATMESVRQLTDRPNSNFRVDQFDNPPDSSSNYYQDGD